MKYRRYTAPEVVEQTREAIHLFIRKQIDPFVALLDENFVWIGDYEPLYMCGIPAFLESVKTEMQELPVNITEEEYTLLSHEQHLWITYGRFTANTGGLAAKVHFTFVWKQTGNDLLLLHANANHAKPMPQVTAQSKIFELPPEEKNISKKQEAKRLILRSLNGSIHYLQPKEIQYIKVENNICEIVTRTGSISCRIALKELAAPPFIQLHKSYLVNTAYLQDISRYQATLSNGTVLPIGKERYMGIKHFLQESVQDLI